MFECMCKCDGRGESPKSNILFIECGVWHCEYGTVDNSDEDNDDESIVRWLEWRENSSVHSCLLSSLAPHNLQMEYR